MIATISLRTLAVTLAVAITGCQDPYASNDARPASSPATKTRVTPSDNDRRPGPPAGPIPNDAANPSPSARGAARSFATRWANWNWRSVATQQRTLARLATGGLARQLRANATSTRIDASLARDRPGSRGRVAAIDLKANKVDAAGVVVSREQTYTAGRADLGGQRYRVYLVGLTRDANGWGVSAWEPQP